MCACKAAAIALAWGFWPIICAIVGSFKKVVWVSICASWSWYKNALSGLTFNAFIFSDTGSFGFSSSSNGISLAASFIPITSNICLWSLGKLYIWGAACAICMTAWYCTTFWAIVEELGSDTGNTSTMS